jgi:nucleoid-associated protein
MRWVQYTLRVLRYYLVLTTDRSSKSSRPCKERAPVRVCLLDRQITLTYKQKSVGDIMEVITAAVHFINKKMHKEIASIEEANQELAQSKQLSELVDEILNAYNTRCAQQAGVFQADQVNYPLSAQAAKLLLEKEKLSLLEVSLSVLGRIQQLMNTQLASTGGHLLFVRYRRNDDDFLLIVKLQTVKGQIFRDLTSVEDATHLSVDTLQVAARINLSSWQDQRGERYVTFVSKREQGHTSNYFRDFIGCDVQADNRAESKKLATVIDDFVKAKVGEGELSEDEGITRMRHVFDHAENVRKKRENISLADVASLVWPSDSHQFTAFLNNHPTPPADEFPPDRGSLRLLSDYSFSSKEFKITMSHQFKAEHNVTVTAQRLVIENPPARLVEELQD